MRWTRSLAATAVVGLAGALVPAASTAADSPLGDFFVEFTRLTGDAEVPGPGDPDGRGFAIVHGTGNGEICYNVFVRRIAPATAAHIHVGAEDEAGPVVQGLEPPTDGHSSGCVENPELAAAIADDPDNYYVNVHNAEYPAGAVRGQLG